MTIRTISHCAVLLCWIGIGAIPVYAFSAQTSVEATSELKKQPQPAEKIFRMKPYLQNPTGNGITIMWQTTVPTYSWVEYGTDKENLQRARTLVDGQVICNGLQNKIRLSDLQPGQTYYYRVCSQEFLLYEGYKLEFGETARTDF